MVQHRIVKSAVVTSSVYSTVEKLGVFKVCRDLADFTLAKLLRGSMITEVIMVRCVVFVITFGSPMKIRLHPRCERELLHRGDYYGRKHRGGLQAERSEIQV